MIKPIGKDNRWRKRKAKGTTTIPSKRPTSDRQATNKRPTSDQQATNKREMAAQVDKSYVTDMFSKLSDNIISLVFAKNKGDTEKQKLCELTERKIINTMLDGAVDEYNCFMMLFIAEYKELTYWSICDIYFEKIESDILAEYTRIFSKNCIWDCMSKSHKHDPNHIMLVGKHYQFYDVLEYKGYNILTMTEDEVYDALYLN
jgi:hypothetical protein